jgi:cyclic pyranopterin phosphate synthase
MTRADMLAAVRQHYGDIQSITETSSAPADRYRLSDGTTFGIISSTTEPFCRDCDRSRLTADGMWYLCLYAASGTDLRAALRAGASENDIRILLEETWRARTDRGAEARLALRDRAAMIPLSSLKRDPHLEMHTRGG